jgi:hypothetical protein
MFDPEKASDDIQQRFRRLYIREMTQDEKRYFFLADALLSGGKECHNEDDLVGKIWDSDAMRNRGKSRG